MFDIQPVLVGSRPERRDLLSALVVRAQAIPERVELSMTTAKPPDPPDPQNSPDPQRSRNPHQLRDQWRHYNREHKKVRILTEVMTEVSNAFVLALNDGRLRPPPYGTKQLMTEALQEGVQTIKDSERVLAALEQNAYEAYNAALRQN
jgi:hypothetical protein